MYCTKCGKENVSSAAFCSACGSRISFQASLTQGTVSEFSSAEQHLKKSSVIFTIFLTFITSGIYYPIWFLKRRHAINRLQSGQKLNTGAPIFAIVALSIILLLSLVAGFMEGLGEKDIVRNLDAFAMILNLIAGIALLVQCFKVKRIFSDHFNDYLERDISFSGFATFFFQIYYLQYKINRLLEQIANTQHNKELVETAHKRKKTRGLIVYIGIGISSLLFCFFIIIGLISPETTVITGKMLNKKYLSFVEEKKLIEDGEEIIYWYSDGFLDFKSGFYFFTKKHVVVYSQDWVNPAIIIPFNTIDEIYLERRNSYFEDSTIFLILNDDTEVFFPVSNESGGDEKFYNSLVKIWQEKTLKTPAKIL